jgi:hypothetical protein
VLLKQAESGKDNKKTVTWTDPALTGDKHVDNSHAEAFADQLAQLRVEGVLGTDAKPQWQQDHPVLTVALKDDKSRSVDWTLSKPASGDFYVLKSSAHPWYFSIGSSTAKAMIDAAEPDQLLTRS